jgi:nitrogen-specific signal transduction histidine kinase
MKTTGDDGKEQAVVPTGVDADFFNGLWKESWTYIKTVVDIVREPVLILDKDLHVMIANDSFYRIFQVEAQDTEHKLVYDLGDGQWNIPALRKLLDEILPKNTFFKGFEVIHEFPAIGRKVMILNARQIHSKQLPPIILLAMEDVTEMMAVAETLAGHASAAELRFAEKTQKLELHIGKLEEEINELKKRVV